MTYLAEILADNPTVYWRLGEADGVTVAADSSGNGNTGTLDDANSGPTVALIADPNAARLYSGPGGATPLVDGSASMLGLTAASVEGWFRTSATTVVAVVGNVGSVSSDLVVFVGFPTSGDVSAFITTVETPGTPVIATASGLGYNDGAAHHYAAVVDSGSLTLYFDGVPVASDTYPGSETFNLDEQSGGTAASATTFTLDEAAFYDRALTSARVLEHYTQGINPTSASIPVLTTGTTIFPPTSWRWEIVTITGTRTPWYPVLGGSLEFDPSREIPRTVSGLVSIAQESEKIQTITDRALLYLVREDQDDTLMGTFFFSENTLQLEAYMDQGVAYDINHVGLGDSALLLRRSTGEAETILSGSDPSQEMTRLLSEAGVPSSIAGSSFAIQGDVTWDGSETLLTKVRQLAELAGHLSPWIDPSGIFRSESIDFVERSVSNLIDLSPKTSSIAATTNSLSAPNRVIVTGTEGTTGYPLRGQWDAPSFYLYSESARGYVLTQTVDMQGLQSSQHADEVARLIGLQNAASTLTFTIPPTELLNEPRLIRFRDILWRVDSWSIPLEPNSLMSVTATQYVGREEI